VAVVVIDDRDLGGVAVDAAQPVGGQRAAGSGAEDHDARGMRPPSHRRLLFTSA
jgi:hypothetical protein